MDWRDRFRAPAVISARVARDNPDRGVVISDLDGRHQAYAWDRVTGSISQVTSGVGVVISTAISSDGAWIYAMVESDPGTEVGHIHQFPFTGGESVDLTPELDDYTAFEFKAIDAGLVAQGGLSGSPVVIVIDGSGVRCFNMPSLILGLTASRDGKTAVVTMSTPHKGLVPMFRLLDLAGGEILGEAAEMEGWALHGDRVAVAVADGDWMRPSIWAGGELTPIDVEVAGDIRPVDWSHDGSIILLAQSHRSKSALLLYETDTGLVTRLATPSGGTHPLASAQLVDVDRALCLWSDANHPWRVFESTPDATDLVLDLDGQQSFLGPQWEEFTFASSGGAEIQGWLLRPDGKGPWPTVLYTHGGPTSVAGPIFSPIAGAWFDAGFAVASINYRGSTTFGEAYRESLTHNIGGPDIDDVVAAHRWLVDSGVADPKRIVKNGYSYGGYLTLQALGTHPDLWAAGVAGAPIADWSVNYEDSNDVLREYDHSLFGAPPEELPDLYEKASPRTYAENYEAPILISQPEKDSRTPMRQVQLFVDDLLALGKSVDLVVLEGGHVGSGKEQMIEMVESWLDFATSAVDLREQGHGTPKSEDEPDH